MKGREGYYLIERNEDTDVYTSVDELIDDLKNKLFFINEFIDYLNNETPEIQIHDCTFRAGDVYERMEFPGEMYQTAFLWFKEALADIKYQLDTEGTSEAFGFKMWFVCTDNEEPKEYNA